MSIFLGRVPKPDEPWFLEDDTEAVLEWQREQALKCSGCGLPTDETMDKNNQHSFEAEAVRCHACAARDREAESRSRDAAADRADNAGIQFAITRTDD